jgi:DNA topoisomerase-1
VTLERALECIRLKKEADANRIIQDFGVDNIQVLNGRYGPYITDGKRNARMPKDTDPKAITLETCRELLVNAPLRGTGRFGRKKTPNSKAATPSKNAAPAAEAAPKEKPAKKSAAVAKAPKKKAAAKKSAAKAKKSKAKS